MHHNSHHHHQTSPTRSTTSQQRQQNTSPTRPKIPSTPEGMLKGLDTRFKKIYDIVQLLKQRKQELQSSSQHDLRVYEEDMRINEESIDRLQQEISRITIKNNELMLIAEQNRINKAPSLSTQLENRNRHISDLADQMQTILTSLKSETARTEALEKQIVYLKRENINIEGYMNKADEATDLSKFPRYKNLLKKSSASNQQSPQRSKGGNELDILLNISPKSGRKLRDLENLQELVKETIQLNDHLKHENEKLKKKIMANMHSDYEKPAFDVQNTDRETVEHAKKQQKLKISKLFADEDKLISHISHHTRDGMLTKGEDEYIKKKDAQNEENFRRILEIKELERLRDQIYQQDTYITELERNVLEREHLLFDQRREITSLEDNLKNLTFDIQKNLLERDLLDNKLVEKRNSVEDMKARYEETVESLPVHLRPQLERENINLNERTAYSKYSNIRSRASQADNDDLENLLKQRPKALDLRK